MKKILLSIVCLLLCVLCIQNSFALPQELIAEQKNNDLLVMQFLDEYTQKNYEQAYLILKNNDNILEYKNFEEEINTTLDKYKEELMILAHAYEREEDYDSAIALLEDNLKFYQNDKEYSILLGKYKGIKSDLQLVAYSGPIYSVTIRPLLAFPQYAFTTKNPNYNDLDKYFITPNEYKNIIYQLYQNDFILINSNDAMNQNLKLPANKKPILMCYDNVCYGTDYKCQIDRLIINRDDSIATYTGKKSIRDRISIENEFVPILEDFLLSHPDFSFKNARGVIYLSGQNGILGYKTQKNNANYKFEIKQASRVVDKLKSLGWEFGSNGYSYENMNTATNVEFSKNIFNFSKEVENIVGKVNSYLCASDNFDITNENYNLLKENYNLCINYGDKMGFDNGILHSILIGGQTIRENTTLDELLFDTNLIYDHTNRLIEYKKNK